MVHEIYFLDDFKDDFRSLWNFCCLCVKFDMRNTLLMI